MRRTGRRHISDYLEENEELNQNLQEDYGEYDEFDIATENEVDNYEETEQPSAARVWKKIGKVALVILVLIALFFISMKVTEIFLDRNQEPASYNNDAPAYNDIDTNNENSEDIPAVEETEEYEEPENTQPTYQEEDTTPPPSAPKAEEPKKPEEPEKPAVEAPAEPETPSTPQTPSTPSKPIITPGNPAA